MNKDVNNPFKLSGYHGAKLFCDRENETELLITNAKNGANITLFSLRRMGKTGLIKHVFQQVEQYKNYKTIYVDIYDTQNFQQFVNRFATSILKVFPEKNSIGKRFISLLKAFSPVISYDQFTGMPEVTLSFRDEQHKKHTLNGLFQFLEEQKQCVIVAFDEFQQIANYPENNIEAILRTIIQHLQNTQFIFSGSHKHLLIEMFNSAKRPFFASTTSIHLGKIPTDKYKLFIERLFKEKNKIITEESIDFILEWTKVHTYYTQALCNKVFQFSSKNIDLDLVFKACDALLSEQEMMFFQYRKLLTHGQWELLTAIAKEDCVFHPTSKEFISNYNLGSSASVLRTLKALMDKEMVYQEINSKGEAYYEVYNCFLSRWLSRKS